MTYADKLNPAQKKAVEFDQGPLLIVAGAGSGKTTVITERINWLITKKGVSPDRILALTFTEKAAGEMEERVDKILPYGYFDMWISTFHSFGERILKEHGLEVGLTTDFKLLDETQSWLLVRNNLDKFDLDYYRPLGNPNKFIHSLLQHFSRCKDELVTPKEYLDFAESFRLDNDLRQDEAAALELRRLEEIANAYHVYQQLLLDNNYLDFGDLINYALDLFKKRPAILKQYRDKFDYILVDEFQDTNFAQYSLVKLLSQPKNNITVVGDDDQSIYKFRGASISNILEFERDYEGSHEVFLNLNYRSKQNILDLAYSFIQLNNPNRLEVKFKSEKKLSKELVSQKKGKGMIEHLHGQTLDDEVSLVVNKISGLYQKGKGKTSWNDFAILVRANDQAKPFIEALELAAIPYQFVASRGLFAKPIVLDIVAFLKLLDNFHESDAMYRYLNLPVFLLPSEEMIKLTHQAYKKSQTLFEVARSAKFLLNLSAKASIELDRAVGLLEKYLARARDEKCSRIVYDFLEESGYLKFIDTLGELEKRRQFSFLSQFYKRIKSFEENNDDKSVKNFLRQLGLEIESGEQGSLQALTEDEGPEMVKILTVHSAKGLEFKYVFVVNLVDKRFPTTERKEAIQLPDKLVKETVPEGDIHLQEERRLFYVAITRAKDGIFFSSAEDYGGQRDKKISIFLKDLGFNGERKAKSSISKLESLEIIRDRQEPIFKPPLPEKFSFTQLMDFKSCPRLYYYRYILKVPLKGNKYFSFGSTLHLSIQKFYEQAKKNLQSQQANLFNAQGKTVGDLRQLVSLEDLLKIYEASWIDDWYASKKERLDYFDKGKTVLQTFYQSEHLLKSFPSFLEKSFSIKIDNYFLNGKIDRIDDVAGGFKIIDYKTGKAKEKLESEDKQQLLLYQIAVETLYPAKVNELIYYYLEADSQVSFLGSEKEIIKFKKDVAETIDKIKNFDFTKDLEKHQFCEKCSQIL